jgi:hypothetical protein
MLREKLVGKTDEEASKVKVNWRRTGIGHASKGWLKYYSTKLLKLQFNLQI